MTLLRQVALRIIDTSLETIQLMSTPENILRSLLNREEERHHGVVIYRHEQGISLVNNGRRVVFWFDRSGKIFRYDQIVAIDANEEDIFVGTASEVGPEAIRVFDLAEHMEGLGVTAEQLQGWWIGKLDLAIAKHLSHYIDLLTERAKTLAPS